MGSRLHETFAKAYQDGTSPPERPRNIDPKAPIASLAAGPQQFTAIADTDHGSGKIRESLAQEIPRLAQTGVKHLMLELHINPVESPYRNMIDQQIETQIARIKEELS